MIVPFDPTWAERLAILRDAILREVGRSVISVDHIGSTSVPGLASKDVIDIQATVADLAVTDRWPERIGTFERRDHFFDHVPPGAGAGVDWEKRYWSSRDARAHLHIRVLGRANQRYALLFRDYLRAHPEAASAYERLKLGLARVCENAADYGDVKDPACDLILQAAEPWAAATGWTPRLSGA